MIGLPDRLRRIKPGKGSLTHRMLAAASWSVSATIVVAVLRLGSNLITTRLLFPEAFALMAVIITIQQIVSMMTDIGLSRSVVREPDGDSPQFLNVVFTVRLCVGVGIALVMLMLAGVFWITGGSFAPPDSVLADPILPGLLAVAALVPIINSYASVGRFVAMRTLDFGAISRHEVVSYVVGVSLMLAVLFFIQSVWVLVFGMVAQAVVRTVLSHVYFSCHRISLSLDRAIILRQWLFGRYILITSPVDTIYQSGDKVLLAFFLDATLFGLYAVATIWTSAAREAMFKAMSLVGYSGLSELVRNTPERLPTSYPKFQLVLTVANVGCFLLLFLGGPYLVELLYTDEYRVAGDFLVILGVIFLYQRFFSVDSVLLAQGHSDQCFQLVVLRALGMVVMTPLGFWLAGSTGAVVGAASAGAWTAPLAIYRVSHFMPPAYVRREILYLLGTIAITIAIAWSDPLS